MVLLDAISRDDVDDMIVGKFCKMLQCGGSIRDGDAIDVDDFRVGEYLILKIHIIRCDREI